MFDSLFILHLVRNELVSRQLILEQMLIDTSHIDHLRVNFVAHFNTENNVRTAVNEINTLIENYPREMTMQLRQWLHDQQKVQLPSSDLTKKIEDFEEYLKELEENLLQYQQNEPNSLKFKVEVLQRRGENERGDLCRNFSKRCRNHRIYPTMTRVSIISGHDF